MHVKGVPRKIAGKAARLIRINQKPLPLIAVANSRRSLPMNDELTTSENAAFSQRARQCPIEQIPVSESSSLVKFMDLNSPEMNCTLLKDRCAMSEVRASRSSSSSMEKTSQCNGSNKDEPRPSLLQSDGESHPQKNEKRSRRSISANSATDKDSGSSESCHPSKKINETSLPTESFNFILKDIPSPSTHPSSVDKSKQIGNFQKSQSIKRSRRDDRPPYHKKKKGSLTEKPVSETGNLRTEAPTMNHESQYIKTSVQFKRCHTCGGHFERAVMSDHGCYPVECILCGSFLPTKKDLLEHQKSSHNQNVNNVCPRCNTPLSGPSALCSICNGTSVPVESPDRMESLDFLPKPQSEASFKTETNSISKSSKHVRVKVSHHPIPLGKFSRMLKNLEPKGDYGIALRKNKRFYCVKCDHYYIPCAEICAHYKSCTTPLDRKRSFNESSIQWLCLACNLHFSLRSKLQHHRKNDCKSSNFKRAPPIRALVKIPDSKVPKGATTKTYSKTVPIQTLPVDAGNKESISNSNNSVREDSVAPPPPAPKKTIVTNAKTNRKNTTIRATPDPSTKYSISNRNLEKSKNDRKFYCTVCGNGYKSNFTLIVHPCKSKLEKMQQCTVLMSCLSQADIEKHTGPIFQNAVPLRSSRRGQVGQMLHEGQVKQEIPCDSPNHDEMIYQYPQVTVKREVITESDVQPPSPQSSHYECECNEVFPSIEEFDFHIKMKHGGSNVPIHKAQCVHCKKIFLSALQLNLHQCRSRNDNHPEERREEVAVVISPMVSSTSLAKNKQTGVVSLVKPTNSRTGPLVSSQSYSAALHSRNPGQRKRTFVRSHLPIPPVPKTPLSKSSVSSYSSLSNSQSIHSCFIRKNVPNSSSCEPCQKCYQYSKEYASDVYNQSNMAALHCKDFVCDVCGILSPDEAYSNLQIEKSICLDEQLEAACGLPNRYASEATPASTKKGPSAAKNVPSSSMATSVEMPTSSEPASQLPVEKLQFVEQKLDIPDVWQAKYDMKADMAMPNERYICRQCYRSCINESDFVAHCDSIHKLRIEGPVKIWIFNKSGESEHS